MPLTPGRRLGPYVIESLIGAGGMGEVYRGRDTRLDRSVAIKIVPPEVAASDEYRERFAREARLISRLSHPHICVLHDVGREDGIDFLVMEHLEGETLAERLRRGPIPIDQALPFALQIADALDRAHRQGIVHRDLKPGNVMLTKSGAKLLDFGLAKPIEGSARPETLAATKEALTERGMILGTVEYMAPEQLEGREADARTDLFAFGAILHEMLTGSRAFIGETRASVIGAILKDTPEPVSTRMPSIPPAIDPIVRRCLEKDPDDRWQSARDLAAALRLVTSVRQQPDAAMPAQSPSRLLNPAAIAAGLIGVAALAFGAGWVLAPRPSPDRPAWATQPVRLTVLPPPGTRFESHFGGPFLAVSPDGKQIVFSAVEPDGRRRLWLRALDATTAEPIPGTEGALTPFWSQDGQAIGFFADGRLKRVSPAGEALQTLAEATGWTSATWSRAGTIVFSANRASGLTRMTSVGSGLAPVTTPDPSAGEVAHVWPQFLPDGRRFIYYSAPRRAIWVGSLDARERTLLTELAQSSLVQFAEPDILLYAKGRTLLAHRLDTDRIELRGSPVAVAGDVGHYGVAVGSADFAASGNGVLAYWPGDRSGVTLGWRRRDGSRAGLIGGGDLTFIIPFGISFDSTVFSLSPDDRYVALAQFDPEQTTNIWTLDTSRGTSTRLTFISLAVSPMWSPDGKRLAFGAGSPPNIYVVSSSGGALDELTKELTATVVTDWSRDGRFLLYRTFAPETDADLWVLTLSDRTRRPLVAIPNIQDDGRWSPDGRWVAYTSDESGRPEVYVTSFPEATGKLRVSTGGGRDPRWRADNRELFYQDLSGHVVAVPISGGSPLEAGTPSRLFKLSGKAFEVASDGQRFLTDEPAGPGEASPIVVILNWDAELRARDRHR